MKNRIFSAFLCLALLAGLLVVPGMVASADTITWQDGAVGQYAIVTETPDETPVNYNIAAQVGTTTATFNSNKGSGSGATNDGTRLALTDGNLASSLRYWFSDTSKISYWENITFNLGTTHYVDRMLVGSESAGARNVYVKFYASTDLATLYEDTNLVAESKDGLAADELTVLLKGTARKAQYVGLSTYLPSASTEKAKYPDMTGFSSYMRFSELAVYAMGADEDGFYSVGAGKYKVMDSVPTDTPLNTGITPTQGTTTTNFSKKAGEISYLTDGNLDNVRSFWEPDSTKNNYWEYFTFNLGAPKLVDRLFVASEEAGSRQVHMKFYASTDLATLYEDANLMAETKDGLSGEELNILMQGKNRWAQYIGFATYSTTTSCPASFYRFRELAVYAAPTPWSDLDITSANNTDKIIATENNILATATCTSPDRQPVLTDGLITGVNGGENCSALYSGQDGTPSYLGFDLGSEYVIDSLLVGGGGNDTWGGIGNGTFGVDIYVSNYSRDQIKNNPSLAEPVYTTMDTVAFGRCVELDEAATGRYVVFALYGAPSTSLKTQIWLSELAATGYAADAPTAQGAQVRGTDALRFGFDLVANGVAYADADPLSSGNYARGDLSGATITVNGTPYELKDFGAVVSLSAEDALTLDSAATDATGKTKAVSAEKLYSIIGNTVRFTAVVINIPADKGDTPIYARAYVTYNDGTKDVTLYGDKITRSVNQSTAEALG